VLIPSRIQESGLDQESLLVLTGKKSDEDDKKTSETPNEIVGLKRISPEIDNGFEDNIPECV